MNKILITLFALIVLLLMSCSNSGEPLNAITDLKNLTHSAAHSKYQKVTSINKEDLYGEWTIISSFFTNNGGQAASTFGLEGRKYKIKKDGSYILDNSALGFDTKKGTWKLESNNTVFNDGVESNHIRINGDTMEWIEQIDDDYSYFVLVK
ncbi:MAG: hypothetical protein P8P74_16605 [Crocinitomicaceae bacterium]|nr:hypothetical protein [Crocinitomicaceae bacterium]